MNWPVEDRLKVIKLDDSLANVGVPWVVATYQPQPYAFAGDSQSLILASPGTIFAVTDDHTVTLKQGSVVILAGSNSARVITPSGTVTVADHSAAGITQDRFGSVHVASLVGAPAAMKLQGVEAPMQVASNSQMSIVSNKVASLGTMDFVPVFDKKGIDGVSKFLMSNRQLDLDNAPFADAFKCVDQSDMTNGMRSGLAGLINGMRNSGQNLPEGCFNNHSGANNFNVNVTPIAYVQSSSLQMPEISKKTFATSIDGSRVIQAPGAQMTQVAESNFNIKNGDVLIEAGKTTTVKIRQYSVELKKGTVALISVNNKRIKIHNLCESTLGSMTLDNGKKPVSVAAGHEVILGSTSGEINAEMRNDGIARRRVHMLEAADGTSSSIAEFSMVSIATQNKCIKHLFVSNDNSDKAIKERVLKMAACLMHVTSSRGAYQQVASAADQL